MISRISRAITMTLALSLMAFASIGHANTLEEEPSALAMTGDALIARPLLLVTTVVGSAVYLVSLPFSLLGGNAAEAGETLVVGPAKATFVRCLGCTTSGRKPEAIAQE
ncbi:hypothetical protein [Marinobacter fonticola]|uniref:hypothetical protein n=1 Tax=Marinobacter fonticola TaxID=2603215 RepID=UPI0011E6EA0F|nr:hypothetical protein [Marinobacter fonticola]